MDRYGLSFSSFDSVSIYVPPNTHTHIKEYTTQAQSEQGSEPEQQSRDDVNYEPPMGGQL